jgi:hypothetical protein
MKMSSLSSPNFYPGEEFELPFFLSSSSDDIDIGIYASLAVAKCRFLPWTSMLSSQSDKPPY